MKISYKLMFIVLLTLIEITITLWSVIELSKGATLHQLNSLHLKYSAEFTSQVNELKQGQHINLDRLKATIVSIREQPEKCLDMINPLNIYIMKKIGTYSAYEMCIKDIVDANAAIAAVTDFSNRLSTQDLFLEKMQIAAGNFTQNSALFEKPLTQTVNFLLSVFIPLVVIISLFNILFISYMSRNISSSIARVIEVLKNKNDHLSNNDIDKITSGELNELLKAAAHRARETVIQEEINAKLDEVVSERTISLTSANEELSQFAYRTSHDLKSPVSSSKMLAQLIQLDIENDHYDAAKLDAAKIETQMQALESLIEGILSLTQANEQEAQNSIFSITELVQETIEKYTDFADKNNVVISFTRPRVEFIESNKVRISQILDNLISNAIKYRNSNRQSFVNILISSPKGQLKIQVQDNGLGFPQDRTEERFKMFKRFHPKVESGSGLGLSIVKKHTDFLNGSVDLESSCDGSLFTLMFPIQRPCQGAQI